MAPSYPGTTPSAPSYPAAPPPGGGAQGMRPGHAGGHEGPDIRHYIGVVLSRWWLILLFGILGAGAGLAYIYMATPLYRATCRVEVIQDPQLSFDEGGARSAAFRLEQELSRRGIFLRSGMLNSQVRDALLDEWKDKVPPEHRRPRVSVNPVRGAQTMIDISVDGAQKDYAKAYLSELLDRYKEARRAELLSAKQNTLASLSAEKDKVADELQAAENELAEFHAQHSIRLNEAKAKWDEAFLASLIQRQNALRMEATMLESQFETLDQLSAGTIQEVVNLSLETHRATLGQMLLSAASPGAEQAANMPAPMIREQSDWQSMELQLARLEAEYDTKLNTFKEGHPKMLDLKQQIEGVQRDLRLVAEMAMKRLQERHRAVTIQQDALSDAINTWRAELSLTVAERTKYQQLEATVEKLTKLHDAVYSRWLEGTVLDIDSVYSRMVEPVASAGMIWPNHTKIMSMSVAGALAMSIALAFLLHHFDTTLLDIAAAEERFGITYVSGIPHWGRLLKTFSGKRNTVLVTREKTNVATEVYRTVRGTLEHLMGAGDDPFALCVTSSDSGDGKSLTAINLAVVFAWTGKRVLLVDGDLRRGAIHKALEMESGEGFTELLTGGVDDWKQVVQKTEYENLDFITSGQYVQESPEQLGSKGMQRLLDEWRENYDLIVFDTAPVSRVMDTAVLARVCDGVLLVARFAKTRLPELQHLLRRLEGTRVLGFCVNCIDFHKLSKSYYGYSGYYGYGYRDYGYGYYRYYAYYRPYGNRGKEGGSSGSKSKKTPENA